MQPQFSQNSVLFQSVLRVMILTISRSFLSKVSFFSGFDVCLLTLQPGLVNSHFIHFSLPFVFFPDFGRNFARFVDYNSLHSRNFVQRNERNLFTFGKCFEVFWLFINLCFGIRFKMETNCPFCAFGAFVWIYLCCFSRSRISCIFTGQKEVKLSQHFLSKSRNLFKNNFGV